MSRQMTHESQMTHVVHFKLITHVFIASQPKKDTGFLPALELKLLCAQVLGEPLCFSASLGIA
jgi:hypothetical protein